MSRAFEAAVTAGEADAPRRIIDFWGGAGAYAAMPEAVQAYCRQTAATNVLDWHTDFGFAVPGDALAALQVPVLLVRGALANPVMVQIIGSLREQLPRVTGFAVEGAGYFLVSTHPVQCAALLDTFLNGPAAPSPQFQAKLACSPRPVVFVCYLMYSS